MKKLILALAMMLVVTGVFADNVLKQRKTSYTTIFLAEATNENTSAIADYYVQLTTDTDCYNIYCADINEAVLVFNRCSYPYEIKDWARDEFYTGCTDDYLVSHHYETTKNHDKWMSSLKEE